MRVNFIVILMVILLSACGGGQGPIPTSNGNNNGTDKSFWHHPPKQYHYRFDRFSFSNGYMYGSSRGGVTVKTDGKKYSLFKNPDDNLDVVNFVNRHGRMFLVNSYTDDGFDFKKNKSYRSAGMFCVDTNTVIICENSHDYVSRITYNGLIKKSIFFKIDGKEGQHFKEPASNGINTFIVQEKIAGLLISQDSGLSWVHSLPNTSGFTVVAGNINHSSKMFAGRAGAVYITSDAGTNWHKATSPTYKGKRVVKWVDMELLDDGVLIGLAEMEAESGIIQYLFKSSDFANTWKLVNKERSFFSNVEANDKYYFATSISGSIFMAPR